MFSVEKICSGKQNPHLKKETISSPAKIRTSPIVFVPEFFHAERLLLQRIRGEVY